MLSFFLNKFFSAHLTRLWKEMPQPHQWCRFYHPYSYGAVHIDFKSNGLMVSLDGCGAFFQHSCKSDHVITSFNSHSHIGDDKPRWRYGDVLQVHLCSQLYCHQECRGELMSFMSGICKLGRCFSCLKIFLILESNLTFQRSCLFKSNCWNEIREMLVFESIFWKSSFVGQRSNTRYSM